MPDSVAFFRNLNLGQRGSPTRGQLLDAFASAGAIAATSFQVNGTVVFEGSQPRALATEVVARLTPVCGYADVAIVRPLAWLRGLRLEELGGLDGAELSVFDGPDAFPETLPWDPPRGDLTVVRADHLHAVSVNHEAGRSNGTRVLERLLGVPVSSRGVATVLRLLAKLPEEDPDLNTR